VKLALTVVAASAVAGISLAGCGHAAAVGPNRTLRVALGEYRVTPQNVHATAGELTIIVHNVGKLTHNLVVKQGKEPVDQTKPIWPGTVSVLAVYLSPGQYTLSSTLFSDEDLGVSGTLSVSP
jgi:plastocyanin